MISVNVKFIGKEIKSLEVSGHANFANYGKDIVCAGVSAIVIGGINALEEYLDKITYKVEEDIIYLEVKESNNTIQTILNTIYIQLKTIEESYKENIKIKN